MLIPLRSIPPTNESIKSPRAVQFLILTNVIIFIYQLYLHYHDISLALNYGAIPRQLTHIVPFLPPLPNILDPSLITSLFLHDVRITQGGFLHIIGNLLFLSAFGPHLENMIGCIKFLLFYLLCGVLATLFYVAFHYNSNVPLIGASGAIAGVMGAHFVACPKLRIRCLFLIYIITLPASIVLIPWILIQLFNAHLFYDEAPIAWSAHIVGFCVGGFLIRKFQRSLPSNRSERGWAQHDFFPARIQSLSPERLGRPKRRPDIL